MRSLLVPLAFGLALAFIAFIVRTGIISRENPGRPINAAMRTAMGQSANQWPERDLQVMALKYKNAVETPSGLRYIVERPGTGTETPKRGQTATVHYVGKFVDGDTFDSSRDKTNGEPFNFTVGDPRIIDGFNEGVLAMTKGEKRTLIIPFWLAYGEKGDRKKIPGLATLVFEIELLDFK